MAKLTIAPLTRLEGHGKVELILESGQLRDVRVRLTESMRLFESLVCGHRFDEVPDIVCRICSICSAVHKLTALKAFEGAMSIKVPYQAELIRELLLLGGHIQSHALHLFLLVLPDFYDEESVVPLLKRKDPLAVDGVSLKAFGNRLQEVMGGRVIHPVNPAPGGVMHRPSSKQLAQLIDETQDWLEKWPELEAAFMAKASYPQSSSVCGTPLSLCQNDHLKLSGTSLHCGDDAFLPITDYAELLAESQTPDSHAKLSGRKNQTFLTGALSRQTHLPKEDHAKVDIQKESGIHANNSAQLKEIGRALNRVALLLEKLLDSKPGEPLKTGFKVCQAGIGTAAMEAPRGLLVHHYVVDEWGIVVSADIVTPTAINQKAMAEQIMADLSEEKNQQQLKNVSEKIIRSYDPCISCAVHILEC